MSFHPHLGSPQSGYTVLPAATYDTLLDSIVADVAAAVAAGNANGWSLWDDQRVLSDIGYGAGIYPIVSTVPGGYSYGASNSYGWTATNGNAYIACGVGYDSARTTHAYRAGWSQISLGPNGPWYSVTGTPNNYTINISPVWAGGAQTAAKNIYEQAAGYIVLRCLSAQKTFYVQFIRPKTYGDILRYRVWETWDPATHTGTVGGNYEILRGAWGQHGSAGAGSISYCLFLLPDAIALWAMSASFEDLMYAGNLLPAVAGDTNALVHMCTNQILSGWGAAPSVDGTANRPAGGVQVLRQSTGLSGAWSCLPQADPTPHYLVGTFSPRGWSYAENVRRQLIDTKGNVRMIPADILGPQCLSIGESEDVLRRGEVRHLRLPAGDPSYMRFLTFGPAPEDGHTYVMLRTTYPFQLTYQLASIQFDASSSVPIGSGFARNLGGLSNIGVRNEINVGTGTTLCGFSRFFLMPIDI
jgi:hypothetical protein